MLRDRISAKEAVRAARSRVAEQGITPITPGIHGGDSGGRIDPQKKMGVKKRESRPWKTGKLVRRGIPCEGRRNGWRMLPQMTWQAINVLTSRAVPEEVYQYRMHQCRVCEHATVFEADDGGRAHFCGCCGCPQSVVSTMETKCGYARLTCSQPEPKFGAWKPGMDPAGVVGVSGIIDPSGPIRLPVEQDSKVV